VSKIGYQDEDPVLAAVSLQALPADNRPRRRSSPNCEAVEAWALDGELRLDIITLCDVRAGEELCLDYALTIDAMHAPEAYPCACSSVECRGTMAASA
jgi:SET domain-containing protein